MAIAIMHHYPVNVIKRYLSDIETNIRLICAESVYFLLHVASRKLRLERGKRSGVTRIRDLSAKIIPSPSLHV